MPVGNIKPKLMSARVENASGDVVVESEWGDDVINKAFSDAIGNQMPIVGFILKLVAMSVPAGTGRISAIATIDGVDYLAGALNVILPTAVEPPAAQPGAAVPEST
jgi:hypothetical protein